MADVEALKERLRSRYAMVTADAARATRDDTSEAAPVGETGDTAARVTISSISSSGFLNQAVIEDPTPQALFTDKGTRPHPIDPVNAKVLRFPGAGGIVFAFHVDHPGNPPQNWFSQPMADRWRRNLAAALESAA